MSAMKRAVSHRPDLAMEISATAKHYKLFRRRKRWPGADNIAVGDADNDGFPDVLTYRTNYLPSSAVTDRADGRIPDVRWARAQVRYPATMRDSLGFPANLQRL